MTLEVDQVRRLGRQIVDEVRRAIVGKTALLDKILATILAEGHVLLEDYPGLAKTLMANSFAHALGLSFKRIQFTPDLLPGDVTGGSVYVAARERFELRKGPLFANVLLADEVNRASPKTQSALLEAMQERQVTLEGESLPLPAPFFVIATQNPIEYEGTFPLPEAQLDRFLVKLSVGYPSLEEEAEILRRRRERGRDGFEHHQVLGPQQLLAMQAACETIHVEPDVERYIVTLVSETRRDARVAVGASPRGSLALLKLARARAALEGRAFIVPDDVKAFAHEVLGHRLILEPDLWMERNATQMVLDELLERVPVPLLDDD